MARLQLNAEDLAKVVVGSSWGPFNEALMSLVHLGSQRGNSLVDGWRQAMRGRLDSRMMPLMALVSLQGFVADLHTVVGEASVIPDALDQLERAPSKHVRLELAELRPSSTWAQRWFRDLSDGDRGARRELVDLLRHYASTAIDPFWGPISAYLEAERARCARIMATEGVGSLLGKLHPKIRWRPPFLDTNTDDVEVGTKAGEAQSVHIAGGRSIVLEPSVFCPNHPWVLSNLLDKTQPQYVVYPALRNMADATTLWTDRLRPGRQALSRLLGTTRADALDVVADTCTTTELARRLGVSPATASHHVGILRDARLIDSTRDGVAVRHRLTGLGAALLDGGRHHRVH